MEIIDTTKDTVFFDLEITEIRRKMVVKKLEVMQNELKDKHFYSLKVTKKPTRTDYHLFSFDKLSEASRKLINGQTSLGGVTNRQFWSKNFLGGFRVLRVENPIESEFPLFNIIYVVYSDCDNLDVKILKNLTIRLRNIDPTFTFSLNYIGKYDKEKISKEIPESNYTEYPPSLINKLGEENIYRIHDLEFQTPKYFGRLFKTKTK